MAGAGYKLFNTGDVLTAAQVNTYLQEQTVMVFANATARTTALSGVLAEGMMSYLQDTNAVEVYNGSAWVSVGSTGDITAVTAGTGISGGGTSGDVTITNSMATAIDAKGDLIAGTGADAFSRLAVGANNTVLTADSSTATGLKWATPSSPSYVGVLLTKTASQTYTANTETAAITYTTESWDTNSFHDNSTNTSRITIPSGYGGKYLIYTLFATDDGINTYMYSNVQVTGGTTFRIAEVKGLGGNNFTLQGVRIFNLSAGDYLEHKLQIGDNKTTNTTTHFGATFLGA